MADQACPFVVLLLAAVAGEIVGSVSNPHGKPFINWLVAAAVGALSHVFTGLLLSGLFFYFHTFHWLAISPFVGGIAGAVVDFPLRIGRNYKRGKPLSQTVFEIAVISFICLILLFLYLGCLAIYPIRSPLDPF